MRAALVAVLLSWLACAPSPCATSGATRTSQCFYQRVHRRLGVDCSRRMLSKIPQTLDSNVEILDVSFNRIRDLHNDTFSSYGKMRYLYLYDNMIQTIEAGTFDPMPNLDTLDLSINSLTTVPVEVFQLPALRNLYLHHNKFQTLRQDLREIQTPIRAPLQYLNLAYCHLSMLPDLGILPDLMKLNISGNPFMSLLPVDLAPYCSLRELVVRSVNMSQAIGHCSCLSLDKWLAAHVPRILYDKDVLCVTDQGFKVCPDDIKVNETNAMYDSCKDLILHRKLEYNAKLTWIIVAACASAVLLVAVCILYTLHKRNIKQTHSTLKAAAAQENNANLETLLNEH